MQWETVIGLEVHAQLKTQSKLFSATPTSFGAPANSQTSWIDAALPGVLPVLNQHAVLLALRLGIALNATINTTSILERKNYFYPDLPKGYQISQYKTPIIGEGQLAIRLPDGQEKIITIQRAHLEEDAGKSIHATGGIDRIDLNRAGIPLLEIVTTPCMHSAQEAVTYLKTLHQLLRFLDICDGNMQEGAFRCDVNLSLKPQGSTVLGTRTELKNLNSFRFIEQAIVYEQARHQEALERGQPLQQDTRLFDPDTGQSVLLRSKENEADYRYFPDPDLPPIVIDSATIALVKQNMPERPETIQAHFATIPNLHQEDLQFILADPAHYHLFNSIQTHTHAPAKTILNWARHYFNTLKATPFTPETAPVSVQTLGALLNKLTKNEITQHQAKQFFTALWTEEVTLDTILSQTSPINASDLKKHIQEVLAAYPDQVQAYQSGKTKLLGFFVGMVMKQTEGKSNPTQVSALLLQYLEENDCTQRR